MHVDDLRYNPHPCEPDVSNRDPHPQAWCFLLGVGTMEWAPCTKLFLKWFLCTYMVLGSTTNSNNRWDPKVSPPPLPHFMNLSMILAKLIGMPSYLVHLMLLLLLFWWHPIWMVLKHFQIFQIFFCGFMWKVTNSQRMGNRDMGMGQSNPCPKDR
jgi:hypothetical protein